MKQALTDEIKYGTEDLEKAKTCVSEAEEAKAVAEGDLAVTAKDLAQDEKSLADLHSECMTKAQEFEAETKSRDEELKALAEAKKVISESTGGVGSGESAEAQTYGFEQVSFLQLALTRLTSEHVATVNAPPAPAAAVNPKGVPNPGQFAEFLPFMADAQPEIMMKDRCRGMLNRLLEKSAYDPQLTLKLLPKCHWAEDQCKQLQDDLVARIPKVGGPAAAPGAAALLQAPAPAAAKNFAGAPLLGDEVYGWCDTMWEMARANRVAKMQAKAADVAAPTSV